MNHAVLRMESSPDAIMNGTDSPDHPTSASLTAAPPADAPSQTIRTVEGRNTDVSRDPIVVPTTYAKRLLSETLSSKYPHGLVSGEPRTPAQQEALEARKAEILRTMSDQQIEDRYQETAKKVEAIMREIEEGNERVDREVEAVRKTRETERKVWASLKKAGAER